ncbi:DUF7344 domain-containing protein [Natronobacterium gregoryi]|uniref:DUF7344 domain-containing protein n=2 Tax=Natronobacterium gregoryi TaxID=44930 RepID=L0AKY1_NATGS|nr:hypothetical protein [Natronobacterium gregoryi]AFZ73842.1 hypothetical protein Natgr_2693 [Natronobacterium gregoryi SP2]ELY65088.1 hypothetical protein C490_14000 [Natronobacterium gregoryi SP2]PLK19702.1 hypothetical protein CYV19_13390 [Natronobacterium gregoryi SP2]SFJ42326.1 hypothetical protein SAMN05443661_12831 [Natronobacterium gregoryi]
MSSDAHLGGTTDRHLLDDVPAEQYGVFQHPRRVRLLAALEDLSAPSLSELTAAVLEREAGEGDVPATRRREVRTALVHNHVPRLDDHGIVEWDRDRDVVELRERALLQSAALADLLEGVDDERAVLDRVLDPLRLRLIDELAESSRPLSLEQLASKLAAYDGVPEADRAKVGLHHSHLPTLEDAGVLDYDRRAGLASLTEDVPEIVR